ncbi:uncharacterized protein PG986_011137 [Apiospora aurea]|uniref:Plastocyanin-like domain-containing protein n=1 Tax=Apiospora aurea TaxID=335848 RepID=A0ABR1Q478_9PEZI
MALLAHALFGLSVVCQAMGAAAAAVRGTEPCESTATSRRCWGYWLTAEETAMAPDGYLRPVMAFNGSIPGPTIEADWGDNVIIHVTNKLMNNGYVSTLSCKTLVASSTLTLL